MSGFDLLAVNGDLVLKNGMVQMAADKTPFSISYRSRFSAIALPSSWRIASRFERLQIDQNKVPPFKAQIEFGSEQSKSRLQARIDRLRVASLPVIAGQWLPQDLNRQIAQGKLRGLLRDVLLSICRRSDFVIRWGGDEFVVVAKQTQAEEAKALAERVRASVAAHNFYLSDGQLVRTTCSIGFVSYPLFRSQSDDSSLDQLICIADGLMYEAKKRRDAWVGMLSPTEATASVDCDTAAIEATSVLFQARRAGSLTRFSSESDESIKPLRASAGL